MIDGLTVPEMEALTAKIFEYIGEASMCWSPAPQGVFDTSAALEIGKRLLCAVRVIYSESRKDNGRGVCVLAVATSPSGGQTVHLIDDRIPMQAYEQICKRIANSFHATVSLGKWTLLEPIRDFEPEVNG